MSTITREFTKEQLIERCKEAIASLKPCVGIAETKSLACFEIALASLEAEPVAEVYQPPNVGICAALGVSVRMLKPLRAGEILYTAPPVPVSVPDAMANDIDSDDHPLLWSYNNGWNACRAAMLQGAELVTTAYKLNSPVIPDGWVMVPVEPTEEMNKAGWEAMNEHDAINPTYRAMLAAAPQQEVKP